MTEAFPNPQNGPAAESGFLQNEPSFSLVAWASARSGGFSRRIQVFCKTNPVFPCGVGFSPQRWLQPPNQFFRVAWAFPKDPQSGSPQPWLSPRPATG